MIDLNLKILSLFNNINIFKTHEIIVYVFCCKAAKKNYIKSTKNITRQNASMDDLGWWNRLPRS